MVYDDELILLSKPLLGVQGSAALKLFFFFFHSCRQWEGNSEHLCLRMYTPCPSYLLHKQGSAALKLFFFSFLSLSSHEHCHIIKIRRTFKNKASDEGMHYIHGPHEARVCATWFIDSPIHFQRVWRPRAAVLRLLSLV